MSDDTGNGNRNRRKAPMKVALTDHVIDGVSSRPRIRGTWADRLEVLIPSLGYLFASLFGATTSSLGMLRQDPSGLAGTTIFAPQAIRSDEWLTQAPIELGIMVNGTSSQSPLSESPDLIHQVTSGIGAESILFWESNLLGLGRYLPDAQVFSAFRNLPLLLLLLTMPPLLRRFGANRAMSWLATVLTVLAPASVWWSFMPVRTAAIATTGSYLLVLARDRLVRGSRATGLLLVSRV